MKLNETTPPASLVEAGGVKETTRSDQSDREDRIARLALRIASLPPDVQPAALSAVEALVGTLESRKAKEAKESELDTFVSVPIPCAECGALFSPSRRGRKYHTRQCEARANARKRRAKNKAVADATGPA